MGTVGSGVLNIIKKNNGKIEQTSGQTIVVKKVLVRNLQKYQEFAEKVSLTTDFNEILSDPEIKIVTEVMGSFIPQKNTLVGH